jgi:methionyl-tRNA formyltransferase
MNIVLLASCPNSVLYLDAAATAGVASIHVLTSATSSASSPLAASCERLGVPLERRDDVNAVDVVARARSADLLLVAGWGRILGAELVSAPRLGALNFHPSLLPAYRGREPLFWALLRGEKTVGISVHRMTEEVDGGAVLFQHEVTVPDRATSASLATLVDQVGAELVAPILALADSGSLPEGAPQVGPRSHFPPLRPEHGLLDFTRDAWEIDRLVRAATGEIAPYAFFHGFRFVVLEGDPVPRAGAAASPGRVIALDGDGLLVAAARGAYRARRFLFLDRVHDAPALAAAIGVRAGDALSANPAF